MKPIPLMWYRVTDSSPSRDISFIPTSFKSPQSLRPIRARDTAYFKSYATDVSVALINVAINFRYEYFCFVIYFSEIFLSKLFFKILSKIFSWNFFSIFFPKIFFSNFFPTFCQNFFFSGFYSRPLPVYREKTNSMYLCYEKYDIQQAVEFGL